MRRRGGAGRGDGERTQFRRPAEVGDLQLEPGAGREVGGGGGHQGFAADLQ
ncbi:hypothetical protein [Methylomagnum ishizawai]|uniref:hypothetical protein n=1 Tax=Methylomagnum ishizawai TaxID=1760988 RepID=UPI0015930CD7|nr:hypothetical protein [Methylomagnum ishizawai]